MNILECSYNVLMGSKRNYKITLGITSFIIPVLLSKQKFVFFYVTFLTDTETKIVLFSLSMKYTKFNKINIQIYVSLLSLSSSY